MYCYKKICCCCKIYSNPKEQHMTSISKNVYINKLDHIVNKYSHTYHSKIKLKSADVKSITYIDFNKENNNEVLNLKLIIM